MCKGNKVLLFSVVADYKGRQRKTYNVRFKRKRRRIAAFGSMDSLGEMAADEVVDAGGGMLFPSFCDSHTHLVYAGSREQEFLDKINGLT